MFDFQVSTVPADGLAPSGARPSAGIVLAPFQSCVLRSGHRRLSHSWKSGGQIERDNFTIVIKAKTTMSPSKTIIKSLIYDNIDTS